MIKIAQIGAGHWGRNLVRNFAAFNALGMVVDLQQNKASELAYEYDVLTGTFEQALANDAIDAISFAISAKAHAKLALRALEAGKHVFVEKPLALSVAEAERIIEMAKTVNRVVMVGHLLQYHPVFVHAHKMVKDGALGKIHHIYSNRMSLGKFYLGENVWWSLAPHDISMVLSLADEEPVSVTAQGASYVTPGMADYITAQFRFGNGIRAHFNISWLHPFKEQRTTIIGEKGMLVFEDSQPEWEHKLAYYPYEIITQDGMAPILKGAEVEYIQVKKDEPLKNECRHFIDCIEHGKQPHTDGHEGLAVLRCLHQGEEALVRFMKA